MAYDGSGDSIQNYIDGKRTVGEIVRLVSLEALRDTKEDVLNYLGLLEQLNLISK